MKITWRKNPLESIIELENELERTNFRLRIENDLYSWAAVGAQFYLDGKHTSVDIKRALDDLWVTDSEKLKEQVSKDYEMYLQELNGVHCGDCTCVPSSCDKCHAEELAGVWTIKGLYKHPASRVAGLFSEPGATPESVLNKLANPDYSKPNEQWKGEEDSWFSYVPKWTEESHHAYEWLKKYYEDHPEALTKPGGENADQC